MKQILWLIVAVMLVGMVVAGAGVVGPAPEYREFDFVPGKVIEMTFHIKGAPYLDLLFGGALQQYAEVSDPNPGGGARDLDIRLILPEYLPPGEHKLYVGAVEQKPGGMVGGRAGAMMSITIKVLADEPALKANLEIDNTALNVNYTTAHLEVESWSKQNFNIIADVIMQYDNGTEISRTTTPAHTLLSNEGKLFDVVLSTKGLPRGYYRTNAIIYYDKNQTVVPGGFIIGDVDLSLERYTDEISQGKYNRFSFTVLSDWNRLMKDVEGVLLLDGEEIARSPSVDIPAFKEVEMELFIDAADMALGAHEGELLLSFMDRTKQFPITFQVISQPTKAAVEAQQARGWMNSITMIYFLLILLVIVNVFFLFKSMRKKP